jgi:hypothetical protein
MSNKAIVDVLLWFVLYCLCATYEFGKGAFVEAGRTSWYLPRRKGLTCKARCVDMLDVDLQICMTAPKPS